ncbi:MAG: hypothetical protein VX038_03370 [Verrucomicrobiota bacterium]|nr:hypothetical protein [Verrucomicrobiota bacterium]
MNSTEESLKKVDNTVIELSEIQIDKNEHRHIESDYRQVQTDLATLSSIEKDLTNFTNYLLNENENVRDKWSAKSAESVNASITRLYSRLRKKCRNSFISLPQNTTNSQSSNLFQSSASNESEDSFGFSFSSYDGFWPSFTATEARKLGVQSEIVNEMIDYLSVCTDFNHTIEIISIQREAVGQIDKANIGEDNLDLSDVEPLLLRDLDEIESYVFKLSLNTQTIPLRKFINKLRPPFLLREILINPVEENSDSFVPTSFEPDPFSMDSKPEDKFVPIVSKVDSRVDIVLEYVIESRRDLTNIIKLLAKNEESSPQIIYTWLKKSGHEYLIKETQKYFNEANTR